MKNKIKFLSISFLIIFCMVGNALADEVSCTGGCPTYDYDAYYFTTSGCAKYIQFQGYHTTSAGAAAAVVGASPCGGTTSYATSFGAGSITVAGNSTWHLVNRITGGYQTGPNCPGNCNSSSYKVPVYAYYYIGSNPENDYDVDADNDGIMDSVDPYLDDDTAFEFTIIAEQTDGSGNRTYFCIETNRGDVFCYGEQVEEDPVYYNIGGGTNYLGPELSDMFTHVAAGGITGDIPTIAPVIVAPYVASDEIIMESGLDQDGGTDSVLLGKIVDNTNQITLNQAELGTYQNDIRNSNDKTNELLSKIIAQNEVNKNYEIQLDIPEMEWPDDYTGAGTSEGDWATGSYSGLDRSMTQDGMPTADMDAENYTDQSWFTTFINNNPYKTALDNSGVEVVSPVCTQTLTVLGADHVMDLCFLEDPLSIAGNVLLAFVGLLSLVTIVRGW